MSLSRSTSILLFFQPQISLEVEPGMAGLRTNSSMMVGTPRVSAANLARPVSAVRVPSTFGGLGTLDVSDVIYIGIHV